MGAICGAADDPYRPNGGVHVGLALARIQLIGEQAILKRGSPGAPRLTALGLDREAARRARQRVSAGIVALPLPCSSSSQGVAAAIGVMQQCATLGSARLSLLVWNDSACPTTARELPQRTPAIVPQQESERSGIDGRRLLLPAQGGSDRRDGCGPAFEICGSPDQSAASSHASPAFVKTRYSGLIAVDDRPADGGVGLAGGEERVRVPRSETCIRLPGVLVES
jgi:hypothetical protein